MVYNTIRSLKYIGMLCMILAGACMVNYLTALPDSSYAVTAKTGCTFCDIVAGRSPATVILETPEIMVIQKPGYRPHVDCLIIPKKHIENFNAFDDTDPYDADIVNKMRKVAVDLSKMITGPGHYTIVCNNGSESDQTQFHLHWHYRSHRAQWKPNVTMVVSPKIK